MGSTTSSSPSTASVRVDDAHHPYVEFLVITRTQLTDALRFFYSRYDFNHHLLTYPMFEDIFWRFFDNPDRQRKVFNSMASRLNDEHGTMVVSALEFFAVAYVLSCEHTRVGFSDKLDWAMAFFQFQSPLEHWDDGTMLGDARFPLRPTDKVRKDDLTLFLETAGVGFCRLAKRELLDPLATAAIVDGIFADGERNLPWAEVKEQLVCNGEVVAFLQGFHEVLNWMDLARDLEKAYDTLERRFANVEQMQKIRAAEQDAERERLEKEASGGGGTSSKPVPPGGARASRTLSTSKTGGRKVSLRTARKGSTRGVAGQLGTAAAAAAASAAAPRYSGGLSPHQCVDMIADALAAAPAVHPLEPAEVDALRYVFGVVADGGWVSKATFETAAASVLAFSFLDQLHRRNKLYEGSMVELRELSSRRYMDVAARSTFFDTHFDNSTDAQDAFYYQPPRSTAGGTNQQDPGALHRTSCDTRANEIFVRSLDLQLPTDAACPRKGREACGALPECFYITRVGWVEFQCGVFERCGAERALLKAFQRLDTESKGVISADNVELLVRDRLGAAVEAQIARRLAPPSQEIVNENIRHLCKAFAAQTADALHGESTWDNIQAHISELDVELHGLRTYINSLESYDEEFPKLVFHDDAPPPPHTVAGAVAGAKQTHGSLPLQRRTDKDQQDGYN